MPQIGTTTLYLCITNIKNKAMNTNVNLSSISVMFSSEESYSTLVDMINDMELELMDVNFA